MPAKVFLVGAGPGDAGLITLKGVRCLQAADVVIYDYLVNPALLAYARADAKLVFVGKKGFSEHVTQEQINALLIKEALVMSAAPRVIVRLKGGDPFVFGRGGEEALALREHGISFEVVPGVTSGIAAPAHAGIPVTHRGVSSSVAFVTGSEDPAKEESAINWEDIAQGAQTLCLYMGVRNLESIAARLMAAGRAEDEPVALIRWGTTSQQEVLTGTLVNIASKARTASFQAPAIIVVGDVVSLRKQITWHDDEASQSLPLAGLGIAVTRTQAQTGPLVERLRALGAEVRECPVIRITPVADTAEIDRAAALLENGFYQWVVFTSTNGVKHFFAHLERLGLDARAFGTAKVAAIGASTAEALKRHGILVDVIPPEYRAESIATSLLGEGVGASTRVLIARARHARDILPQSLEAAGARVDVVAVYETERENGPATYCAIEAVARGEVRALTFTSTSTVMEFAGLLREYLANRIRTCGSGNPRETPTLSAGSEEATTSERDVVGIFTGNVETSFAHDAEDEFARIIQSLTCYSIGPITSAALESIGAHVQAQAQTYTIDGLVSAIVNDYAARSRPPARRGG